MSGAPTYAIERTAHGFVVRGSGLPASEFKALTDMAAALGFDKALFGLGHGIVLGITNDEHADAWRAEIDAKAKAEANGDAELEWVNGSDTGISSLTIFSVLSEGNRHRALSLLGRWPMDALPDVPHDPSDFGRCYRLLKLFPAWRTRLGEVARKHQAWAPFVAAWPELEALFEQESRSGMAPKLYARMQMLRERGVR